jgi:hypothetical protein
LFWRAVSIQPSLPLLLSFFDLYLFRLLPISEPPINSTAIIVAELLTGGAADYWFAALSAFGHWRTLSVSNPFPTLAPKGNEKTELVKNES